MMPEIAKRSFKLSNDEIGRIENAFRALLPDTTSSTAITSAGVAIIFKRTRASQPLLTVFRDAATGQYHAELAKPDATIQTASFLPMMRAVAAVILAAPQSYIQGTRSPSDQGAATPEAHPTPKQKRTVTLFPVS